MDRVMFFDPFAAENVSVLASAGRVPAVPAAAGGPAVEPAVPLRGREREVEKLLNDLALLAATRSAP